MSKIIIVGGRKGISSGVISKLYHLFTETKAFQDVVVYNGCLPTDASDADLLLWFPDINNEEPKDYPIKGKGAVLVCSKVMRDETTRIDAVTRIFNMHGNAVTAIRTLYKGTCSDCVYVGKGHDDSQRNCGMIYSEDECSVHNNYKRLIPKPEAVQGVKPVYEFELIDALNNNWIRTTDLKVFVDAVLKLYSWTKGSQRKSLTHVPADSALWDAEVPEGLEDFMSINRELALKVAAGCGNRYFGNFSTRCTKLFPSKKISPTAFAFSPRNVDKRSITSKDLVLTSYDEYYGNRKPSVDAPVQLELYRHNPNINFMIHGHAYIKYCAANTQKYFPCGDLREVEEVLDFLDQGATRINLCNHGFLLIGKTVSDFYRHLNECSFEMI